MKIKPKALTRDLAVDVEAACAGHFATDFLDFLTMGLEGTFFINKALSRGLQIRNVKLIRLNADHRKPIAVRRSQPFIHLPSDFSHQFTVIFELQSFSVEYRADSHPPHSVVALTWAIGYTAYRSAILERESEVVETRYHDFG